MNATPLNVKSTVASTAPPTSKRNAASNLLAFEESDTWIPRIDEYHKCTGANIRLQYVVGGEDSMADALIADVGLNNKEDTGEGIYDAYIVQAPWLPPVYMGLKRWVVRWVI